jgi:hypothetical protein
MTDYASFASQRFDYFITPPLAAASDISQLFMLPLLPAAIFTFRHWLCLRLRRFRCFHSLMPTLRFRCH